VDQDKNYYYSAEIAKNDLEVYTVMVKSTKEIGNLDELLESFKLIPQKAEAQDTSFKIAEKNWDQETRDYYQKTFIDSEKMQWGIFDATKFTDLTNINEQKLWEEFTNLTEIFLERWKRIRSEEIDIIPELNQQKKTSLMDLTVELVKRMLTHCNFCRWNCQIDRSIQQKVTEDDISCSVPYLYHISWQLLLFTRKDIHNIEPFVVFR